MEIFNIDDVIDSINSINYLKQEIFKYANQYLKNPNLDIENKWALYCLIAEYLPISSYMYDLSVFDTKEPYDDFGFERYQTVLFENVIEKMEDMGLDTTETKQEIINSGYSGFIFDW